MASVIRERRWVVNVAPYPSRRSRRRLAEVPVVLVLVAAAGLAAIVVFRLLPLLLNLPMSLLDLMLVDPRPRFVGLANYARLLSDAGAWRSIGIAGLYTAGVVGGTTLLGLLVASALRGESRWSAALRVGFLLPAFLPSVVAATVWRWCLEPFDGPVNAALSLFGIAGPAWLADPTWALASLIVIGVWKDLGLAMAIYLAALAHVPPELEEAAWVDGASTLTSWRHVVMPLLGPATALVVVTGTLRAFDMFAPAYLVTGGGPLGATTTFGYYLFRTGFENQFLGYAAAMTVVVSAVFLLGAAALWRRQGQSLVRHAVG